jgi:hypothetical protein
LLLIVKNTARFADRLLGALRIFFRRRARRFAIRIQPPACTIIICHIVGSPRTLGRDGGFVVPRRRRLFVSSLEFLLRLLFIRER